jgi:selenocysteine-specific elongation factor
VTAATQTQATAGRTAAGPLTLGTAGHIDHGKTMLIRALTGTDTDRLPEERARGISIELGYASLTLPSGRRLSVIDVPGHERFVRTMVAGATGIDLYLMTVAADDGVMPQTREHARVLQALDVTTGVVAVTKSDLADPEIAMIEASELLPGAEIVAVSAPTGDGLDELRAALDGTAARARSRAEASSDTRLHIDRVFTIRGAGTVVTGTLWSGAIVRGEELVVLPQGLRARVRGVQIHDHPVPEAPAGQRVAVNLTGIAVSEVARGDVLVRAGSELRPTYLLDAQLRFDEREPEHHERVQVHHGTREAPARLAWLGGRFWQIRLEHQLVPKAGDRLVVRQIAPPDTLGGGLVLDAHPRKHGPGGDVLVRLERLARGEQPERTPDTASGGLRPRRRAVAAPPRPEPLSASALATEERLRQAGFEPPLDSELDPGDLAALRAADRAVRVSKNLHYHPEALAEVRRRVIALAERHGGAVTLAQLRDELGTSRKFAQALLEHLDASKATVRRGDEHVVRASRARPEPGFPAGRARSDD